MTREAKVRELMAAANAGISTVAMDATAGEVLSAYVTLASSALHVAREMGTPVTVLRSAVEQMLLQLTDLKEH